MNAAARADIRLLIVELCIPIALVLALDRGFGWSVVQTPSVPVPQLFGGMTTTSGKFLVFRERARDQPALDVLFLGMSQMMRVNGQRLEADLSEYLQRPVRTFNFAGPYHSFGFDRRLLRDLVVPLARPAVVVYGLTPLALLNEIVPQPRIDAQADGLPIFGMYTGSPAGRLRGFMVMHLQLLQYREVIRDALTAPLGWKRTPFDAQARAANSAGDVPLLTEHTPVARLNGWELHYRQRFADFDTVLRRTLLFDHLAEFAEFCRQLGVELVLLNNPVHPLFLETLPDGRQDYDRYLARLRQAAAQTHVRLFEPVADGIGAPNLYQDTVHHDPAGGAWLTGEVERYLIDNHLLGPS